MSRPGRVPFMIGAVILALLFLTAVFAPMLAPWNPHTFGIPYQGISAQHPLGTNDLGQDILSELIYGSRTSLLIGLVSAFIVTVVGTVLGLLAGYLGGITDKIIIQITNIALSLPSLVLSVLLAAFLNVSIWNIILAICVTAWTQTARIVRTRTQQIKNLPFVQAERMMSAGPIYIMVRHILPNLSEIVYTRGVLSVAGAMLTEASLSFLGLGVINQKSWGGILHYAFFRNGLINGYWWWFGPPILLITLSIVGFMLLGYYSPFSEHGSIKEVV